MDLEDRALAPGESNFRLPLGQRLTVQPHPVTWPLGGGLL